MLNIDVDVLEEDYSSNDNEPLSTSIFNIDNIHTYDDLFHMNPSDEASKFIVLDTIHKMWNDILKANEEGNLNYAIEKIKQEDGGKFWKHIQSTFLNEFHEVNAIEKDDDYKFPNDLLFER